MSLVSTALQQALDRQRVRDDQLVTLGIPGWWLAGFKGQRLTVDDLTDEQLAIFLRITATTERFWHGIDAMQRVGNLNLDEYKRHERVR